MKRLVPFIKKYGIIIAILAALAAWGVYSYFNDGVVKDMFSLEAEQIAGFVDSFGIFSYVIFLVIVILEVVLAPVPPLLLYATAGILYSSTTGGLLVLAGNLAGATINFFLARKFGAERLQAAVRPSLTEKFNRFFDKYGALSVFLLRVNPLTTSDLVSYIAGFTRMRYVPFMIATAFGLAPLVFLQTFLGDTVFSSNSILIGIAFTFAILFMVLFGYLVIISLIGNREKKEAGHASKP